MSVLSRPWPKFFLACLMAACSGVLTADVLVSESFDYASSKSDGNTMSNANGGTGWGAAWDVNSADYFREAGLTFPGVNTAGGHVETRSFQTTAMHRNLDATYGADGTTVWFSFLAQRNTALDTAGSSSFFGVSFFSDSTKQLFFGKTDNSSTWGVERSGGGGREDSGVALLDGNMAMLVARVDFASGNDTVNLWVFEDTPPTSEAALGVASVENFVVNDFSFNRIRIGSGNNVVYNVDELILATDYSFVIPETGTLVMLLSAMTLLGLVLIRRRTS
jgi:hypothetical protein